MKIFDPTLDTLERALDVRLARHNLLAGNLANADTPGFVPRDLDFAAAMREGVREQGGPIPLPREAMTFASAGHRLGASGDLPLGVVASTAAPIVPAALPPIGGSVVTGQSAGLDGNAVDVDRALAAVAENAIQYSAAARAAQKKLAILRYAASDGAA